MRPVSLASLHKTGIFLTMLCFHDTVFPGKRLSLSCGLDGCVFIHKCSILLRGLLLLQVFYSPIINASVRLSFTIHLFDCQHPQRHLPFSLFSLLGNWPFTNCPAVSLRLSAPSVTRHSQILTFSFALSPPSLSTPTGCCLSKSFHWSYHFNLFCLVMS